MLERINQINPHTIFVFGNSNNMSAGVFFMSKFCHKANSEMYTKVYLHVDVIKSNV